MTAVESSRATAADPARIGALLSEFAAISAPGPGVTRLAYTPLERAAHDHFTTVLAGLGLRTWTDAAGNTIAERAGTEPGRPALGTGSHLDSVPHGGRFDGIAGVVAAMEVARLLTEAGTEHRHPVRFVVFAGEEGARFGQACTGSKLVADLCDLSDLEQRRDAEGSSIADAMRSVGLDPSRIGECRWARDDWAAFVELHVEQGGVLEQTEIPIGVVDLISGSTRLELTITGRASHTGATPMRLRGDALAAAAEVVLLVEALANDARHHGTRATVGRLDVYPGSITTIPGLTRLAVDIRDIDSDRQRHTATELIRRAQAGCDERGVSLSVEVLADASPVVMPVWVREAIAKTCRDAGVPYRVMTSGASHDAQMVNRVVPTGMIFVPSRAGLSHVPEEWSSAADIAAGTDILHRTLLALDRQLNSPA